MGEVKKGTKVVAAGSTNTKVTAGGEKGSKANKNTKVAAGDEKDSKVTAAKVTAAATVEAGVGKPRRKGTAYNSPNDNKRKANPVEALIVDDAEPTTKKAKTGTKKKGVEVTTPPPEEQPTQSSEEEPTQTPGKDEFGGQDPDFTMQPGNEVVDLVPDGTQDKGQEATLSTLFFLMLWRCYIKKISLLSKFL
jgi:hypothetical protein